MNEEENELFAKQIHLPVALKKALKVQAVLTGYGNLKNMIEKKIIEGLDTYNNETET